MRQATKRHQTNTWREQINQRVREGAFILLSSVAIYLFISLFTYNTNDPGWSHTGMQSEVLNLAGRTGAFCSDILFSLFGYIAYLFPVAVSLMGIFIYKTKNEDDKDKNPIIWFLRVVGLIITLASSCGLTSIHINTTLQFLPMSSGGVIGALVKQGMVGYLNLTGATIMLSALFLTGVTLFTGLSWVKIADLIGRFMLMGAKKFPLQFAAFSRKSIEQVQEIKLPALVKTKSSKASSAPLKKEKSSESSVSSKKTSIQDILKPITKDEKSWEDEEIGLPPLKEGKKLKQSALDIFNRKKKSVINKKAKPDLIKEPAHNHQKVESDREDTAHAERNEVNTHDFASGFEGEHILPSLSLLEAHSEAHDTGFSSDQLEQLSSLVETRLKEFGVDVKVVGVLPGPVVTRFELDLAAGVKVSKITGLAKDLARSLSVVSVRVVEVIPGKSVVGLEIPNVEREVVRLKEVLADPSYQQSKSPVTIGLGKDISGRPMVTDLAKMPHLLVAGTTGSGKSVGLNAMLLSILYKASPKDVRMILIDPKMLELAVYDNIPHLLTPVITDVKDAANALRWCVAEMEHRYQLMAALGVRNITGYNERIRRAQAQKKPILNPLWHPSHSEKPEPLEPLPYIVILIDEFADMMMVVGKKVEEYIARLAQKARAAGVHLILATQRPSVDVITGLIKANIPTRIAFQVSSRIDSRTILDQSGAEQLLGHGDMLFLPPGVGICQRIHGAFVGDDEVHKVTDELRKSGKPDYIESVVKSTFNSGDSPNGGEPYDELYDQAVAIVTETRRASISLVQRKLKIGYNRAARLIEQMETDGVVSELQSNGTREVLAPPVSE